MNANKTATEGNKTLTIKNTEKYTPQEKRQQFFAQNLDIKQMYDEILRINENSTLESRQRAYNSIVDYAKTHSPFYAKYDLCKKIPIMTKVDLIDHYDEIFVPSFRDQKLHVSSTSGSTGIPFSIEQNYEKRRRTIADLKVYGLYAKCPSHEKILQLRAFCGKELDRGVDIQNNIWRYDISFLTIDDIPELIEFINNYKPRMILGYDSTVDTISTYILDNNIKLRHQVHSIIVGGEMLSDEVANRMRNAFGCPIYDRYSNQEMGIYAQREYGITDFKFNVASYFLEIVKLDADEPCAEGEIGRIVVTDLFNKAFPMLRYDTGDLGSYVMNEGNVYLKDVLGRRLDTIFDTKGRARLPHVIAITMWGVKNVKQWQFIQRTITSYMVKIIPNGQVDNRDIEMRLKKMLGDDADIEIAFVDSIPVTNSQKIRYIINEMHIKSQGKDTLK